MLCVLFSWWTERLEKRLADWYRRRSVLRELIFDAERSDDEEEEVVASWGGGAQEEEMAEVAAAVAAAEQKETAGARGKSSKGGFGKKGSKGAAAVAAASAAMAAVVAAVKSTGSNKARVGGSTASGQWAFRGPQGKAGNDNAAAGRGWEGLGVGAGSGAVVAQQPGGGVAKEGETGNVKVREGAGKICWVFSG